MKKLDEVKLTKLSIFYIALTICVFFTLGWFFRGYYKTQPENNFTQLREDSEKYKFINPLLLVDNSEVEFSGYKTMESELKNYIDQQTDAKSANKISVYYRDLNNGNWAGVYEKENYIPSSLLKVPTLIAYLKIAENNIDILSEKVNYKAGDDSGQFYKPENILAPGVYQIRTILSEMIVESENTAAELLDKLHLNETLSIYHELQLPDPLQKPDRDDDFMSPEEYSKVFRILYNSSYLPKAYSENALKLLATTKFNVGLVKGVPSGIVVAHKFGEHTKKIDGVVAERQLHDCGIVYYPEHPYFLCVMTKGQDFEKLQTVISDTSKITYDYINKKYSK